MAKDRNTDISPVSEIERALSTLLSLGTVVELRAFKDRTTASGYFDNQDALTEEVTS
jgi:hypothetical protein